MSAAPVTPDVLKWAIDESGLSLHELAERLKIEPAHITAWMAGTDKPTRGQLTRLAEKLKRPRAMFFLPDAPVANSLPGGLRSPAGVRGEGRRELTFEERLHVRRARRLQSFLATLIDTRVRIPTAERNDEPQVVGQRLRRWTGIKGETQTDWTTAAQAFRSWREAVEVSGVAVLALPMGKEGIRGFALDDERVPMIAVNTADIHEARCFTLFHELAHLTLADDRSCAVRHSEGVEQWCDRVASHALIPRRALDALAAKDDLTAAASADLGGLDLVKRTANRFKVSRRAAAIALEEVGAVEGAYSRVESAWPSVDRAKRRGGSSTGGRTSPRVRIDEYGGFAVRSVLNALDTGSVSELVASDQLRLDRTQLSEASQLVGEFSG